MGKAGLFGDKSPFWKGDGVGYYGIHRWLDRVYGRPKICENCGTTTAKKYEWANISKKYHRKRSDFMRLCVSCHRFFDKGNFCKNGHRFTKENTWIRKNGWRVCKICRKKYIHKFWERKDHRV